MMGRPPVLREPRHAESEHLADLVEPPDAIERDQLPFRDAALHAGRAGRLEQVRGQRITLSAGALQSPAILIISFVPLYEVAQGSSEAYGNRLLALMLLTDTRRAARFAGRHAH